jgi:beta-galactosidase GanA
MGMLTRVAMPQDSTPQLRRQGSATQLIVDGQPFLVLGGELGNSTSSSLEYMRPVWPKLVSLNLNTVLVPVYWELLEPVEGKFDFTLVDGLDSGSAPKQVAPGAAVVCLLEKQHVLLTRPAWVKRDQKRFPRAQDGAGRGIEILSPFSKENMETDARAFAAFMRHLREVDGRDHTVIMVQVENEIGMIPDSRDRSAIAESLFKQSVPAELMSYLEKRRETLIPEFRAAWAAADSGVAAPGKEVFGAGPKTDEIFMAWYFGRYVNRVAQLGAAEYRLPMFVNAALIRPGYQPGQYPSAGALPHLIDVWRAGRSAN